MKCIMFSKEKSTCSSFKTNTFFIPYTKQYIGLCAFLYGEDCILLTSIENIEASQESNREDKNNTLQDDFYLNQ